ncbi:hypothetical protein [Celeribacter indicus]|uniref:Uncharacterized protein n=1 Tax=Celeribacter indicus TaxID=1208324 RepID=A0A0B5E180_9RHOB|nr:hypothetical protein [Celeribacter indicus]AJE49044.1 hypothetical protein P73_4329 [Celeribacter indicus]SDW44499.1 hypothetical protein SAMN05443573_103253 [Celeribacter indicus]
MTPPKTPKAKTPKTPKQKASGAAAVDRLRDDIDRGGTGDKVAFVDPAAAPLGTDDEAAGHSPTAEEAVVAAGHERARPAERGDKATPADLASGSASWGSIFLVCVVVAVIVAIIAWAILGG